MKLLNQNFIDNNSLHDEYDARLCLDVVKKLRNITIFCTIIWSATTLKLITTLPNINLFNDEKIVLIIWIACSFYFATISGSRSLKGFINYE